MNAIQSAGFSSLDDDAIKAALRETLFLRNKMTAAQARVEDMHLHPVHLASAQNLLAYLALRRHDIRPLQQTLSRLGVSSLGRCEADALTALDRVIEVLHRHSSKTTLRNRWRPTPRRCSAGSLQSVAPGSWSPCPARPPPTTGRSRIC
jgi:hypothetical protein